MEKERQNGLKLNLMSQNFYSNFTVVFPREIIMTQCKGIYIFEVLWVVSRFSESFCYFYFSRYVLVHKAISLSSASLKSADAQNSKEGGTGVYIH